MSRPYLYGQLLEYASQKNWSGLYNIACIKQYQPKEWLSKDWMDENVINVCKDHIKYTPIIDTPIGKRIALYDVFDDEEAFIITAPDEAIRMVYGLWQMNYIRMRYLVKRMSIFGISRFGTSAET